MISEKIYIHKLKKMICLVKYSHGKSELQYNNNNKNVSPSKSNRSRRTKNEKRCKEIDNNVEK